MATLYTAEEATKILVNNYNNSEKDSWNSLDKTSSSDVQFIWIGDI